jgi:outer membrane protein TolC
LYERQVLPAAEASLADARAAYIAGSLDFLRLLAARRQLVEEQTGYQRALANYHRNLAELARAVGSSSNLITQSNPPPAPTNQDE